MGLRASSACEGGESEGDEEARQRTRRPTAASADACARRGPSTRTGLAGRATGRRRTRSSQATTISSRISGAREDVVAPVVTAREQPVGEEDARRAGRRTSRAGRGTAGSSAGRHERAGGRDRPRPRDEQPLRDPRHEVLQADRARVDVRERLVALVDGEREQCEHARRAAGGDRGQQAGRVADVARHRDHGAEREERDRRQEVAERPRSRSRRGACGRSGCSRRRAASS